MLSAERVLYEDNHCLGVIKSAGELSQGDRTGDTSLLEMGKAYIKTKYDKPGAVYLGLVHRLDRPVSGVMLFARTSKAASRLSDQFRRRTISKTYLAVVEGYPPENEDTLVHYIAGDRTRRKVTALSSPRDDARRAEIGYRIVSGNSTRTCLEIDLRTGVKHQIRAQLSAIGCPIVGDVKYDKRPRPAVPEALYNGRAIALHAIRLTAQHPTRKTPLILEAPLPTYWPKI